MTTDIKERLQAWLQVRKDLDTAMDEAPHKNTILVEETIAHIEQLEGQLSAQIAEPVAWGHPCLIGRSEWVCATVNKRKTVDEDVPLYTHPPVIQTEQPSLSDADLLRICHRHAGGYSSGELRIAQFNNDDLLNLARALLAQRQDSDKGTCAWTADDEEVYQTSCGQAYVFIDGGPKDNGAIYCHHCSKPIVAIANGAPK